MAKHSQGRNAPFSNNILPFSNTPQAPDAPNVLRILDKSPAVRSQGYLSVAQELLGDITIHNGAEIYRLALAIACLCREIEDQRTDQTEPRGEG